MNFFITNREIITDSNGVESVREDGKEKAADKLRFGTYADGKFILYPEPDNELEGSYANLANKNVNDLKGSAHFFKLLYDELSKGGKNAKNNNVLFFIHGFNTNLEDVRSAFKKLQKLYVDNPKCPISHIIIFTWPGMSPKIPYHYFNDREDAIASGKALARGIEKVTKFFQTFLLADGNEPCNRSIHLMAHSMGNRVLEHVMLELKKNQSQTRELFSEVILMAADVNYNIFEPNEPFSGLIEMGKRVHVYFHEGDRVLDISKYTKNFSNRLGRYGRKKIDSAQIDVFDSNVSKVKDDLETDFSTDKLNHWYYYSSSEVVSDVAEVLNGKKSKYAVKK
ncbi:MAG: alpha/beta hydrolase [Cytophagales bacterium]|jgi:esterase/lipase superfamily enzyme|nr:alpha/beta hydrolase [Cytophagales bacterium]MCA6369003.1 alpha/beta hydrolase [Cytophagales bacterium]MCA6371487.1 alpha/beta hydrolase [Cytophagales bacterium]MCA6377826.1 alpha/beta hydrolase [Cytophagales bacterium]MCA6385266.1 alpha/beta hydrolase [Cytophagales bacterium]